MFGKNASSGIKYVPKKKKLCVDLGVTKEVPAQTKSNVVATRTSPAATETTKAQDNNTTIATAIATSTKTTAAVTAANTPHGMTCTRLDLAYLFPGKRDAFAVIIDNAFTQDECRSLIERSEAQGYDPALVGGAQLRVDTQRNNWRCIIDDATLAEMLFERLREHIPTQWLGYNVVGLNERMRFLKYHPGEYFKPHNDGIYVRENQLQCSYVTIHLYLSDVVEDGGGETTFTTEEMTYGRHAKRAEMRGAKKEEVRRLPVHPKMGRVLIFEHHLPHEGSTLLKGEKYTVRTDVMYALEGREPFRGPRWGVRYPHPQYKLGAHC